MIFAGFDRETVAVKNPSGLILDVGMVINPVVPKSEPRETELKKRK